MRELGPAAAALEAPLASVLGGSPPLVQRLQLRELQQAYVLLTLLMKKARVRRGLRAAGGGSGAGGPMGVFGGGWHTARWGRFMPTLGCRQCVQHSLHTSMSNGSSS